MIHEIHTERQVKSIIINLDVTSRHRQGVCMVYVTYLGRCIVPLNLYIIITSLS